MNTWRLVAEIENPAFLQRLFFWSFQALVTSLPLAGLSVILHRAGRRGIWPSFPWALAMLCGPVYAMILWLTTRQGEGYYQYGYLIGCIASWASGAGISVGICVVLFAIIGLTPPPHPPKD